MAVTLRLAEPGDTPTLRRLIDASVRGLQAGDYTPEEIEGALASVYGVDTQLILDGTYYVVESDGSVVGCGGWSRRRTLFGGDHYARREDALLDPLHEPAKIRAFFVHPDWARQGIGAMILDACERAAVAAQFVRLEMGATLTGVPFYTKKGYTARETVHVPLPNGAVLTIVRMYKELRSSTI